MSFRDDNLEPFADEMLGWSDGVEGEAEFQIFQELRGLGNPFGNELYLREIFQKRQWAFNC